MTQRTFITPGGFSHLQAIAQYLHDDVCGILVQERLPTAAARAACAALGALSSRIYTLDSFVEPEIEALAQDDRPLYEGFLRGLLSDSRVHYLAARTYLNSAFNNSIRIEQAALNSIAIVRLARPCRLIASSTPHCVEAWIFAKSCEYLEVPVLILERSPIINRSWIYQGMDTQEVVPRDVLQQSERLSDYSLSVLREQRGAAGARDRTGQLLSRVDMVSVRGSDTNQWWSLRRELSFLASGRFLTLPIRLVALYVKRRLYKSYRSTQLLELPSTPFVIFFMHYQPERTSLPEGLSHAQQWTAIRSLSLALPAGWTLLVREHPATWFVPLDVTVRTVDLYDQIAALPNTRICSMDLDTFELIDRCRAASTLTGSVGFQAILRDKPVIAFGLAAYKDHPACFSVRSLQDVVQAFGAIQKDDFMAQFNQAALEKYLLWVENNSIVADATENDMAVGRLKNFDDLYRELLGEDVLENSTAR